jgi:hypothetical protein
MQSKIDNKNFDSLIHQKLRDYHHAGNPAQWEKLEAKWRDQSAVKNNLFDKQIREKLLHHSTGHTVHKWEMLANRLRFIKSARENIIKTKMIELFTMLIIFSFYYNHIAYQPSDSGNKKGSTPYVNYALDMSNDHSDSNMHVGENMTSMDLKSRANLSGKISPYDLPQLSSGQKIPDFPVLERSVFKDAIYSQLNSEIPAAHFFVNSKTQLAFRETIEPTENIELLAFNTVSSDNTSSFPEIKAPDTRESAWSLMPTFIKNISIVASPFDPFYNIKGYTRVANNKGLGMMLGYTKNKHSIFSGINFKNTEYQPRLVEEIYGTLNTSYNTISLTNVAYQVIEVPLIYRRTLINKKGFDLFAGIRAGINGIIYSNYNIDRQTLTPDPPDREVAGARTPILEQKDFTDGMFQGGKMKDNIYFTGGLEMGIEKKIYQSMFLNIGAGYSKYLSRNGKGPNNDKFDELSFYVGLRKLI